MKIRFWGVRGSIPAPGSRTVRYGGNTSCVEVDCSGELLIFDAGTGIRELGNALMESGKGSGLNANIFIGHTHWDHIQGFPFFVPLYVKGNHFNIYGPRGTSNNLKAKLDGQMSWDYFPVSLNDLGSSLEFVDLPKGELDIADIHITTLMMNHPGHAIGYKVQDAAGACVYTSDFEPRTKASEYLREGRDIEEALHGEEKQFIEFLKGVDVWIADGQYTVEEYVNRVGWGHSPVNYTLELAIRSGVKHLVITHHDPCHSDEMVDAKLAYCKKYLSDRGADINVSVAAEGEEIVV